MKINGKLLLVILALSLTTLPGCGIFSDFSSSSSFSFFGGNDSEGDTHVTGYTPDSLTNYRLGREYAAAGRYELAREHYLIALAAANNQQMQDALVQEINGVDMMIKSLR